MDYVPGKTLEQVLNDAGGRIQWQTVVTYGIALCDVLAYLHSRIPPFVFRDLKLSNVMLDDRTGKPVLIDFGITRQLATANGTAIGTWGYVPYEQILGKAEPRSDLYALGATLHALITGQYPDAEYTRLQRSGLDVEGILRNIFQPVDVLVPGVPATVSHVLTRATAFNLDNRFPNANSMKSALQQTSGYASTVAMSYSASVAPNSQLPAQSTIAPAFSQRTSGAAPVALQLTAPQDNASTEPKVLQWAAHNGATIKSVRRTPHLSICAKKTFVSPIQWTFRRFIGWLCCGIFVGCIWAFLLALLIDGIAGQSGASSGTAGLLYLICLVVVPILYMVRWKRRGRRTRVRFTVDAFPSVGSTSQVHLSASKDIPEVRSVLDALANSLML